MTATGQPERIGPYRIEERLGAGGMGTVYRAYDERLRRRVAVKQIHPERAQRPGARERFLREARAVARLNHPALVHLHDILETDSGDWLVMELVEGPSLARLLAAGPLDPGRVLVLARDVAGGLAAAHAAGILHRDLKTENVVVTKDGRAKLLDFGLAAHVEVASDKKTMDEKTLDEKTLDEEPHDAATLTGVGQITGTPRAMSPEQVRGQDVDHRSDLFSLGVLLYEMATGHSPFLGPGPAQTLARVCHDEQDPAREHSPDVPKELSELIDRLLQKEPSARPASAAEVVETLQQIARGARGKEPATAPAVQISAAPEPATAVEREPFQFRGERRQLTLLCCELSGASLDPEILFEVLPPFQAVVNEAIERYEGHLRDVQGHRFVACFGYPRSHEDNARRAVLAALQIVARTEPVASGFKVCAGVHTGPAVILPRETGEHLALGATLDLATALQERTEPGTVLVSALTRRLVAEFFEDQAVAAENGACAFRVVAARNVRDRVAASEDLTPFVGCERELALLAGRFELAREGVGQAVLITGEAGAGKSRLLRELLGRLVKANPRWVSAYGSPYARNLPLHPAAGLLRRLLEIGVQDSVEDQLARLAAGLAEHDFPAEETMPLFATLLGLPGGELDFSRLRRETLEAVPALLQAAAERRPMVIAFEDLHLVDPMTLELIGRMIDEVAAASTLLVLTCRPGFRPPWGYRAQMTQLRLAPLDDSEVQELIDELTSGTEPPAEVRERVAERGGGVPLFVEELSRDALAPEPPEGASIPAPLRDLLAVRLDRLGTARDLARIAAVLGREIGHDELAAVSALDEHHLAHDLDRLLDTEVLARRETTGQAGYRFQSALVREAAHASVLAEDAARIRRRRAAWRQS